MEDNLIGFVTVGASQRVSCMGPTEDYRSILTIREMAEILRCSRAHVLNLLRGRVSGAPPLVHIALGRRKVVRHGAFLKWLQHAEIGVQSNGTTPVSSDTEGQRS